jgi:head-tail adaptor
VGRAVVVDRADQRPRDPVRAQLRGTVSHKITLRHLDGVATTYRVKFGSRTFAINAVITPREVKDELWLFCTESTDPAPQ